MSLFESQTLPKLIIDISVFTALFFGITGFGLGIDTTSPTANCPFGGHSMSICKMNPVEHIQELQSMFTMLPAKNTLALFLFLALFALYKLRHTLSVPKLSQVDASVNLFYIHRPRIIDSLEDAFSSGILNPKIF